MRLPYPLVFLALPALLFGQAKHTPTLDEMLSLKTIAAPKISPDGRFVAYQMRETNWKDDEFVSQLWLTNVASGANFQLTRGKKSSGPGQWSPDGRWLAFVAERESTMIEPLASGKEDAKSAKPAARQIWLISPEGGEAWQLTKSETGIEGFR